jgi:pyridoxine/pyridoxamine 5'-phosphate oxidase
MSPVRKAPQMPISWNWKSAWKCRPRASQPVATAWISTMSAKVEVRTTMSADSRSSTSTMPKGAGQSPSR